MSKKQKRNYWKIAFWILLALFLFSLYGVGMTCNKFNEGFAQGIDNKFVKLQEEGKLIFCEEGQTAYCYDNSLNNP